MDIAKKIILQPMKISNFKETDIISYLKRYFVRLVHEMNISDDNSGHSLWEVISRTIIDFFLFEFEEYKHLGFSHPDIKWQIGQVCRFGSRRILNKNNSYFLTVHFSNDKIRDGLEQLKDERSANMWIGELNYLFSEITFALKDVPENPKITSFVLFLSHFFQYFFIQSNKCIIFLTFLFALHLCIS